MMIKRTEVESFQNDTSTVVNEIALLETSSQSRDHFGGFFLISKHIIGIDVAIPIARAFGAGEKGDFSLPSIMDLRLVSLVDSVSVEQRGLFVRIIVAGFATEIARLVVDGWQWCGIAELWGGRDKV
jgi:hypothetical protein